MINKIVVVGASGYIGRHLLTELARLDNVQIRILSRSLLKDSEATDFPAHIEIVKGDLCDVESLGALFEPDCTVIHLAYLWNAGEAQNLAAILNLTNTCKSHGVKRLIHLSTAMVSGRTPSNKISEDEFCEPITEYAITKLKIENIIIAAADKHFDTVILRPTAVFGPGSENLKKLSEDLLNGNRLHNYLKSCLFGKRRMNLVCIGNVIASIIFLVKRKDDFAGDVFIISDADIGLNNFQDVERILMREFEVSPYVFPRLTLPLSILSAMLTCLGKDNINPRSDFLSEKLPKLGFQKPVKFEDGLLEYAAWYRSSHKYH